MEGIVVKAKMDKTAVVRVSRAKMDSKYGKQYMVSKKYKAHDESNSCAEGDSVIIEACRPISKDKKWRIIKMVKSSQEKV